MNADQQHRLQLAFQHLERFSLPGIGTFRKERLASRVDNAQGRVLPPAERFVLEPGEHHISAITEFLFRHLQVNHGNAEAMVRELASALRREVELQGQAPLAGVGILSRDRLYGYQLEAEDLEVDDLFGLGQVNLKQVQASQRPVTSAEKKKVIEDHIEFNTVRVEPPPPPAGRRRRSALPWVLLLLLLGIGVAGYLFWPQIRSQMVAMGWMQEVKPPALSDGSLPEPPVDTSAHGDSNPAIDTTHPAAEEPVKEETHAEQPIEQPRVQPKETPQQPKEQPTVATPAGQAAEGTVPSVAGTHYLVISSTLQAESAIAIAKGINSKKHQVKVIRPFNDPFYRVTVFSSKSKAAVIQRMVETKSDFQQKSYIWSR